jgi:hypothetical protein
MVSSYLTYEPSDSQIKEEVKSSRLEGIRLGSGIVAFKVGIELFSIGSVRTF